MIDTLEERARAELASLRALRADIEMALAYLDAEVPSQPERLVSALLCALAKAHAELIQRAGQRATPLRRRSDVVVQVAGDARRGGTSRRRARRALPEWV